MILRWVVRPNAYHDSVRLMRVSDTLAREPGVLRAAAVMATPLNLELLVGDGLLPAGLDASPDDLLLAVTGEDAASVEAALARAEELLLAGRRAPENGSHHAAPPRTLEQAVTLTPANLAVIGVPGQYAAAEAFAALRSGLHVFLFSDNVPLEDEVRLKQLAAERNLLMMGPDCGTAILDGIGLGFANRVRRGPVGLVGASGTGLQQVCCLLDAAGVGIAQAIGTGGRDLSAAVGGSMTRRALWALDADPQVEVIGLVSKPADPETSQRLQRDLVNLSKPAVVCLLGEQPDDIGLVRYAATLADTAALLTEAAGGEGGSGWFSFQGKDRDRGKRVYGLFAGGTLCAEAAQILDGMGAPHDLLDLGADEYTRGRAHPIIDPRLRASMLADLGSREDVGAVLFDVILGDLAHPDPASPLVEALEAWHPPSAWEGPTVLAVLIGTEADPQGLERQRRTLEGAGAQVFASNAAAARAAGHTVRNGR